MPSVTTTADARMPATRMALTRPTRAPIANGASIDHQAGPLAMNGMARMTLERAMMPPIDRSMDRPIIGMLWPIAASASGVA